MLAFAEPHRLPLNLERMIERIGDGRGLTPARAAFILATSEIEVADLLPWADFDHPAADSYGRRLVAQGSRFELMVMSWLPGDYSAIHDHGSTEWGAVRYFGKADHVTFAEREGRLRIASRQQMTPGAVCEVDHDLIHLMGNARQRPFLSLHLYGLERPMACITGNARVFDLFESRIQRTDGGVFYNLPASQVTRREPCPVADAPTTLLHHRLMLARTQRMLATGANDAGLRTRARILRSVVERLSCAEPARTG